jgi:hypothetical protein
MTNEQINIAIAEACGWYEEDNESEICWTRDELTYYLHEDELPDYCNDLNAMHEAEKTLSGDQWLDYMLNLQAVLVRHPNRDKWTVCRELRHATARQLAEAFLRTLGKWKE